MKKQNMVSPMVCAGMLKERILVQGGLLISFNEQLRELKRSLKSSKKELKKELESARKDLNNFGHFEDCGSSYERDFHVVEGKFEQLAQQKKLIQSVLQKRNREQSILESLKLELKEKFGAQCLNEVESSLQYFADLRIKESKLVLKNERKIKRILFQMLEILLSRKLSIDLSMKSGVEEIKSNIKILETKRELLIREENLLGSNINNVKRTANKLLSKTNEKAIVESVKMVIEKIEVENRWNDNIVFLKELMENYKAIKTL